MHTFKLAHAINLGTVKFGLSKTQNLIFEESRVERF